MGSYLDGDASAVSASPANAVPASPTSILDNSTGTSGSGRHFPFPPALSTRYCLESADVILQTLQSLPTVVITGFDTKFYTFTPFACSILLAGYTFLMLSHKSGMKDMPSMPDSEGSALLSSRDHGAASCMEVLDGFSRTWMHLQDAASELMSPSMTSFSMSTSLLIFPGRPFEGSSKSFLAFRVRSSSAVAPVFAGRPLSNGFR